MPTDHLCRGTIRIGATDDTTQTLQKLVANFQDTGDKLAQAIAKGLGTQLTWSLRCANTLATTPRRLGTPQSLTSPSNSSWFGRCTQEQLAFDAEIDLPYVGRNRAGEA
jgi:hypothetical protein